MANEINTLLTQGLMQADEAKAAASANAGTKLYGKSWMAVLIQGLNKSLDTLSHDMRDAAGKVNKEDPSTTTNFQVASQDFSLLLNAINTVTKGVMEA